MSEFGYAGEILRVELSSNGISRLQSADYSSKFIGGRGFGDGDKNSLFWSAGGFRP